MTEAMNRALREPLIATARGGPKHGGAKLTEMGEAVLDAYRSLELRALAATEREVEILRAAVADTPLRK